MCAIVAATNRDLRSEIEAGRFRHDLFYRLNVIPIVIPPLRERPEDIAIARRGVPAEARRREFATPHARRDRAIATLQVGRQRARTRERDRARARSVGCTARSVSPTCRSRAARRRPLRTQRVWSSEALERQLTLSDLEDLYIDRVLAHTGRQQGARGAHPRHQPKDALSPWRPELRASRRVPKKRAARARGRRHESVPFDPGGARLLGAFEPLRSDGGSRSPANPARPSTCCTPTSCRFGAMPIYDVQVPQSMLDAVRDAAARRIEKARAKAEAAGVDCETRLAHVAAHARDHRRGRGRESGSDRHGHSGPQRLPTRVARQRCRAHGPPGVLPGADTEDGCARVGPLRAHSRAGRFLEAGGVRRGAGDRVGARTPRRDPLPARVRSAGRRRDGIRRSDPAVGVRRDARPARAPASTRRARRRSEPVFRSSPIS